ncbi:hypothetical protein B0T14DRAFT_564274 [Immersiella caudata]|uniref:Fun14 family protein n=1 Tax=Immersiella caudata TaxID=314043 RepID=A0AA39WWF9_9PEZI|nr:hypothetical protein B0T14DRAFT_564274 [Immersiella caudata]
MASRTLCRAAFRRNALPLGVGLTSGLVLLHQQRPLRLDAISNAPISRRPFSDKPGPGQRKDRLSPEVIKQLSGGSLAGFLTGLLVSVFSKTLVLLIGIGIVSIQVAARYGIDLVGQFKLKKRVESSRILTSLRYNPAFKIAFGVTFALSAFMSF